MDELATRHAFTLPETLLNKLNNHIEVDELRKLNF